MKLLLGLLLAMSFALQCQGQGGWDQAASDKYQKIFLPWLNEMRDRAAKEYGIKNMTKLRWDMELFFSVRDARCENLERDRIRYFTTNDKSETSAKNNQMINDYFTGKLEIDDKKSYGTLEAIAPGQRDAACVPKKCAKFDSTIACFIWGADSLKDDLAPYRKKAFKMDRYG